MTNRYCESEKETWPHTCMEKAINKTLNQKDLQNVALVLTLRSQWMSNRGRQIIFFHWQPMLMEHPPFLPLIPLPM